MLALSRGAAGLLLAIIGRPGSSGPAVLLIANAISIKPLYLGRSPVGTAEGRRNFIRMTKLEICEIEDANSGQVYLYPEGAFYKAYQKSAWLLCMRVHPFKVSARPLKGLDGPLLSVGFPQSSLDKFSAGLAMAENGGKILVYACLTT